MKDVKNLNTVSQEPDGAHMKALHRFNTEVETKRVHICVCVCYLCVHAEVSVVVAGWGRCWTSQSGSSCCSSDSWGQMWNIKTLLSVSYSTVQQLEFKGALQWTTHRFPRCHAAQMHIRKTHLHLTQCHECKNQSFVLVPKMAEHSLQLCVQNSRWPLWLSGAHLTHQTAHMCTAGERADVTASLRRPSHQRTAMTHTDTHTTHSQQSQLLTETTETFYFSSPWVSPTQITDILLVLHLLSEHVLVVTKYGGANSSTGVNNTEETGMSISF